MCITVSKGNFVELESQELCFVGDLVPVSSLNYLALCSLKAGQRNSPEVTK